jgi:hypothetical protein
MRIEKEDRDQKIVFKPRLITEKVARQYYMNEKDMRPINVSISDSGNLQKTDLQQPPKQDLEVSPVKLIMSFKIKRNGGEEK